MRGAYRSRELSLAAGANGRHAWRRPAAQYLIVGALLLCGFIPVAHQSGSLASAQTDDSACAESGPDGGAYVVEVCLSVAGDGVEVQGDAEITAEFELLRGELPEAFQMEFSLGRVPSTGDRNILTDYIAPFSFRLPTERYVDGRYRIEATAEFSDGFHADAPAIEFYFRNEIGTAPESTGNWEPTPGRSELPFVVAVVGDGAGGFPETEAVANLVEGWDPSLLLYLGDVYKSGTYPEFYNYYEPTLGSMKSITNPVPGNHESGSDYQGYFDYWNSDQHYYSVDTAGWHIVGIDNTEPYGQLRPRTVQYDWLAEDLAAHANDCTIVIAHYPRWGLSRQSDYLAHQPIWELLADSGVEMFLVGHEHNYQRWLPLDRAGGVNENGVTQLVVGTGGHDLESFGLSDARVVSGVEDVPGALRLELTPTGANYQFVATDGAVLDSGTIPCTVSGTMTLSKDKSKTEGEVQATLTHFTPDSQITVRWADGSVLGTTQANASGNAVATFRTPSTPYGTYQVTAEDDSGFTATAQLAVIPRVKITESSIAAGSNLRVYLYGFSAETEIEVLISGDGGASFELLDSVFTDADGSGSLVVTIPTSAIPGEHTVKAQPTSGERRSASETIAVTAAEASPVPDT